MPNRVVVKIDSPQQKEERQGQLPPPYEEIDHRSTLQQTYSKSNRPKTPPPDYVYINQQATPQQATPQPQQATPQPGLRTPQPGL
jgi:hypothetical protein